MRRRAIDTMSKPDPKLLEAFENGLSVRRLLPLAPEEPEVSLQEEERARRELAAAKALPTSKRGPPKRVTARQRQDQKNAWGRRNRAQLKTKA